MAYSKYYQNGWQNGSVGGTPITAESLNHIEDGIAANANAIAGKQDTISTLPVNKGGTGITSNPSMLTNLASTSADTVFKASPRPGVTGILPVANGGTGKNTLQATRNAMGLGNTTGALPIANGGSGMTSSPSMLTNLGSTSADNVFKASPRPGVTGTLPAANGGTGQTSLQATRNAMGLGNTTGALPAANGGTGQTSLQATRNAMGLGNTTGALPVANGGTGATAKGAFGALSNLGLHVTSVTLTFNELSHAVYNFSSAVNLIAAIPVAQETYFFFYRSSGYTQYTFFVEAGHMLQGNVTVDLIYVDR